MSLALKKGERIPKGVRRIVCKRIDKALKKVSPKSQAVSDIAVHEARKRFKEIRGTLRLIRDELGEKNFRRENRTFRDAGRPLSALRDAKVLVDTLDNLVAHFNGRVKPDSFAKLKRTLIERRRETRDRVLQQDRVVSDIARRVRIAKKRVRRWPLQRRGWKAIEGGLRKVYRQGRQALDAVRSDATDESLHEWRKRAKDLRYELELLQAVWPEMIKPLAEQAHHLTDLLGEDHDLAVLRVLAEEEADEASPIDGELLFALIDERRSALQREGIELGQKLYEERDREFVDRLRGYWKVGRARSAEPIKPLEQAQ
jgi:CHAD domain-containing protein